MAYNMYSNFDPLVANGILPCSVDSMVNGNAPLYTDGPFNRTVPTLSKDVYTPKFSPQNKKSDWKNYAFGALLTILTFAGLTKLGFHPLKKIAQSKPVTAVKNFFTNLFKKKP